VWAVSPRHQLSRIYRLPPTPSPRRKLAKVNKAAGGGGAVDDDAAAKAKKKKAAAAAAAAAAAGGAAPKPKPKKEVAAAEAPAAAAEAAAAPMEEVADKGPDAMAILSGGAAEEGTRIKGAAEAEAQFEAKPLTDEERAALAKAAAAREANQAAIDAKD
jgi:hypothetical protein